MTKNNTVEKIDEIIKKIEENISKKGLEQKEVKQILYSIDDEFVGLKKSAEEKHKEVVESKVKELKDIVNKAIDNEWGWGRVKDSLNDVEDSLDQLKNEVKEPKVTVPVIIESGDNVVSREIVKNVELEKEVAKWRLLFLNKTPEEAYEELREAAKFMAEQQMDLRKIQETANGITQNSESSDIVEIAKSARSAAESYVQLGSKIGKDSGLGIFLEPAGGLVGVGAGVFQGSLEAGAYFANRSINFADKTREGMKEYAEKTQDNIKEIYENTRAGTQEFAEHIADNTKELIEQGMKTFDIAGTLTKGVSEAEIAKAKAASEAQIAEANAKARVEELDGLKKQLEELRQEKEKQIKELKEEKEKQVEKLEERIRRKDDRIDNLEKRIRELEGRLDNSQEKYLAQVEETAKIRSTSPMPYLKDPQ